MWIQRGAVARFLVFCVLATSGRAFLVAHPQLDNGANVVAARAKPPPPATQLVLAATSRRDFAMATLGTLTMLTPPFFPASAALAADVYTRQTDQFAYEFQPPENFDSGNKPLRTHLDEINFKSESVGGYQFGVTVDPVRIDSLRQFGTPEQVAAKVVLAEVNRDGVFDVTLMEDPIAGPDNIFYQLNYQSKGKRGTKRFITKFYIQKQKLYALTAQCKEDDYKDLEAEMRKAADSFRLI